MELLHLELNTFDRNAYCINPELRFQTEKFQILNSPEVSSS